MDLLEAISNAAPGVSLKEIILNAISEKLISFAAAPPEVTDRLETLALSIERTPEERIDKEYCRILIQRHPELTASSVEKIGAETTKTTRRRNVYIQTCEDCGEAIVEGVCSKCGKSIRVIQTGAVKVKASSDIVDRMRQFDEDFVKLLGKVDPPMRVKAKIANIKQYLISQGVALSGQVHPKTMRDAMKSVGLYSDYIWCNSVWRIITGWRAADFSEVDRILLRRYYQRSLTPFFKRMSEVDAKGKPLMSNLWCLQAILKVIIRSSAYLLENHQDFYYSLYTQNEKTDQDHCQIWGQMAAAEGWTFEAPKEETTA